MSKKVILGGTFDKLHLGHMKLIETALDKGEVTIGLVSDEMLKEWKPEVDTPYVKRKKRLEEYLMTKNGWRIIEISDPYKPAVEGDYDVLIVSYETKNRGEKINEMRRKNGKKPLDIIKIGPVLADDFMPISSTRIRNGEINEMGERLTPVKISLGFKDELKRDIVEEVMNKFFESEIYEKDNIAIDEQKYDEDIMKKASEMAKIPDNYDYGIGIVSGIFNTDEGPMAVEFVVIKDKLGFSSSGHGPGFHIPKKWLDKLSGGMTLGERLRLVYDDYDEELGIIGMLTGGETNRKECIKSALLTAMIPRLKGVLYENN